MKKNQAVRTTEKKRSLSSVLRKSWFRLRLSVRNPSRVPTWDAIVLTAASPEQAQLFEWQLARAKRIGRIAADTVTLAVPDPNGARIGSGAATIHALASLSKHLLRIGVHSEEKVLDFYHILNYHLFFLQVGSSVTWSKLDIYRCRPQVFRKRILHFQTPTISVPYLL